MTTPHELTKTFFLDDQGERWPIYRWGGREVRDYTRWTWRGLELLAETGDNPLTGYVGEMPGGVLHLHRGALWKDGGLDFWGEIAWYAEQTPGLLLALEVDARGVMYAKVWTGEVDLWTMDGSGWHLTTLPGGLLTNRDACPVGLDGIVFVNPVTQLVGPVGTIAELVPGLGSRKPVDDAGGDDDFDTDFWGEALQ